MTPRVGEDARRRDLTFSQLIHCVVNDDKLTKSQQHNITASLRSFVRLTHAHAETEPATFPNCRVLAEGFAPLAHQITPDYWTTIRGDVAAAIRRYVWRDWPLRLPQVSQGWRTLIRKADGERAVTHGLSRFMRFCTVIGVSPSKVGPDTIDRYRFYLIEHSFVDSPHAVYRRTIRNWNWAVDHIDEWPERKLEVPRRDAYIFPFESFPRSFHEDCLRWKRCVTTAHPLMPRSPKVPITLETAERRLRYLRAFASALVHEGVPQTRITSLSVLSTPEHFQKGVRFFWNRAGRRPSPFQRETYSVLRYMSQYWAGADPAVVRIMAKAAARCRRRSAAITDKSLAILQQFDDPMKRERLYRLPRLIVGLAQNVSNPITAALLVQRAVAIDLLLVAPMRLKNLVGLSLERHFVVTRRNREHQVRIVIPREEVKNLVPLSFPLPVDTIDLLEFYVRHFRHILVCGRPTRAFFPGNDQGHVHASVLSNAVTRLIQRYTGIIMHVHAFRHLAAKLFLERHPFRYDLVALLLGHRSIETTRKFYCPLEMQAVSRQYSSEILGRELGDVQTDIPAVLLGQRAMPLPEMPASAIRAVSLGMTPIQLHRMNRRRVAA